MGIVTLPQFAAHIEIYILQGGADGERGFVKIQRKYGGDHHGLTSWKIIITGNRDFFAGSICFLPGEGAGVENGTGIGIRCSFVSSENLHIKKPPKNGKHQNIEKITRALTDGGFFFFQGNSPF